MANGSEGNGYAVHAEPQPAPLDVRLLHSSNETICLWTRYLQASKLKITLSETLKPIPASEDLVFGKVRPLSRLQLTTTKRLNSICLTT